MRPIAGLLFYLVIKMCEVLKTLKKHQNAPTRTHKKSQILLNTFLDEDIWFAITPKPFFEGEKLRRNWVVGAIF